MATLVLRTSKGSPLTFAEVDANFTNLNNDITTIISGAILTDASIASNAGIADTKLSTINAAGKVSNSATTATSANTINAIVARDGSGNFSAGTITANLTGTASAIADDTVTNAKVASNAAIGFSKLAALSSGNIVLGNASNVPTSTAVSGDVTISATGVTAIASDVIVNADINASAAIADTKLATISTAGKVSNSATTATSANTASAIVARDGSGGFSAGTIQLENQDPLRFGDSDNSHYVGLRAPSTVAANVTFDLPATDGTADQVLKTNGSSGLGWATPTRMVLETAKTATGTEVDFTGIPGWVKKITVMFNGVSTNGTSDYLIQLGDAGGLETTGYSGATSAMGSVVSSSSYPSTDPSGFRIDTGTSAAYTIIGCMVLTSLGSNTWIGSGVFGRGNVAVTVTTGGVKTLSDTLTQIRITTITPNTFDAGAINILYEG